MDVCLSSLSGHMLYKDLGLEGLYVVLTLLFVAIWDLTKLKVTIHRTAAADWCAGISIQTGAGRWNAPRAGVSSSLSIGNEPSCHEDVSFDRAK